MFLLRSTSFVTFGLVLALFHFVSLLLLLLLLLVVVVVKILSPLCRVFTHIFLRQTMSLRNTMLHYYYYYYYYYYLCSYKQVCAACSLSSSLSFTNLFRLKHKRHKWFQHPGRFAHSNTAS
jgi:hypothetical protein